MEKDRKIHVTNIQRFCMHDGPGVRTVVFLKGCPLRCLWCHNPETQNAHQQILFYEKNCISCGACEQVCPVGAQIFVPERRCDREKCILCGACMEVCCRGALSFALKEMELEEVLSVVEKDRPFYGKNGGITVSGGEPMFRAEETIGLLAACKERGIGTAVETCGHFAEEYVPELVKYTDVLLWDVKDTNPHRHREYTGVSNEKILENLSSADRLGAKTVLRCIMVNQVNMEVEHYEEIAKLYHSLSGCSGVELLPYHQYGDAKTLAAGCEIRGNAEWIPTEAQMQEACSYLENLGVKVRIV